MTYLPVKVKRTLGFRSSFIVRTYRTEIYKESLADICGSSVKINSRLSGEQQQHSHRVFHIQILDSGEIKLLYYDNNNYNLGYC